MKSQLARIAFLLPFLFSFAAASDIELPEGKGKDVVEVTCTECHNLERVVAQRRDEEGWNAIIREMLETGAKINGDDVKVIVDYLAKNYGPDKKLNINQAPAAEIAAVLKLASAEAQTIVDYRTHHGKFKDVAEVEKASGATAKIESKKDLIEF